MCLSRLLSCLGLEAGNSVASWNPKAARIGRMHLNSHEEERPWADASLWPVLSDFTGQRKRSQQNCLCESGLSCMMKPDVDVTVGWSEIVQQHFLSAAKSFRNKATRSTAKVMGLVLLFQAVWAARRGAELDAGVPEVSVIL